MLIEKFNHSLFGRMVQIDPFSVNSAGLNLQNQCRNAHLFPPTTPKEIRNQAIGRSFRWGIAFLKESRHLLKGSLKAGPKRRTGCWLPRYNYIANELRYIGDEVLDILTKLRSREAGQKSMVHTADTRVLMSVRLLL